MHQCKDMHWAGVRGSKVKDQPQGRQIFGRCERYSRRQIGFGIWNADSELEGRK